MTKKTTIGERIRWVITKHLGMPQVDFAKKIHNSKGERGVSRQLINRWMNDPAHPPEERNLAEIAKIGGVSLVWLRYGEGDPFSITERPALDPVVLETALREILVIVGHALGTGVQMPKQETDGIDASPDIMAVLSRDEEIIRAGNQWTHALSWDRQDIEGKRLEDLVHPSDLSTVRMAFTISRDQKAVVEFDGRVNDKQGKPHNIRWRITSEDDKLYLAGRETLEATPKPGLQVVSRGGAKVGLG